jgi:putative tryptophan/tyrosine transport system substrate-binding protein
LISKLIHLICFAKMKKPSPLKQLHQLPAIHGFKEDAEAAGLMALGSGQAETIRVAATYVDRIPKGAKPADPRRVAHQVRTGEQPQDRQGAGLKIPPSILARADEVIE